MEAYDIYNQANNISSEILRNTVTQTIIYVKCCADPFRCLDVCFLLRSFYFCLLYLFIYFMLPYKMVIYKDA